MTKTIKQNENGIDVFIVVEEITPAKSALGGVATTTNEKLKELSGAVDNLAEIVKSTCVRFENKIDEINKQKDNKTKISELTIEFGLALTAEGGVVFMKASGEATLKISAKLKFD